MSKMRRYLQVPHEQVEGDGHAVAAPEIKQFVYGWDEEHVMAWRCPAGVKKAAKEPAIKLFKGDKAEPHDCIWAAWADGSKHQVPEITCEAYDIM